MSKRLKKINERIKYEDIGLRYKNRRKVKNDIINRNQIATIRSRA